MIIVKRHVSCHLGNLCSKKIVHLDTISQSTMGHGNTCASQNKNRVCSQNIDLRQFLSSFYQGTTQDAFRKDANPLIMDNYFRLYCHLPVLNLILMAA